MSIQLKYKKESLTISRFYILQNRWKTAQNLSETSKKTIPLRKVFTCCLLLILTLSSRVCNASQSSSEILFDQEIEQRLSDLSEWRQQLSKRQLQVGKQSVSRLCPLQGVDHQRFLIIFCFAKNTLLLSISLILVINYSNRSPLY